MIEKIYTDGYLVQSKVRLLAETGPYIERAIMDVLQLHPSKEDSIVGEFCVIFIKVILLRAPVYTVFKTLQGEELERIRRLRCFQAE